MEKEPFHIWPIVETQEGPLAFSFLPHAKSYSEPQGVVVASDGDEGEKQPDTTAPGDSERPRGRESRMQILLRVPWGLDIGLGASLRKLSLSSIPIL